MGNCTSSTNTEESRRSRLIDLDIKQDEKRRKFQVKLLLLGAGESGKSTILKQMRLIHTSGFTSAERDRYREVVFKNIVEAMQLVLEAMLEYEMSLNSGEDLQEFLQFIMEPVRLDKKQPLPVEYLEPLKVLWADNGVRECCKRGNEFALHDNMEYFYSNIDRVFDKDYVPTDQDIIRCRLKTIGICETVFPIGQLTYRMFDVGGQRSERKKWIHCFEDVTAVVFVVAISGYDQCMVEDKDANQMQDAISLFDAICNSRWFTNTPMVILFNKYDVFEKKIQYSPLKNRFPDYRGPSTDAKESSLYIKRRFVKLNRATHRNIYSYFTDATDTNLLRRIMGSVRDIVINQNWKDLVL